MDDNMLGLIVTIAWSMWFSRNEVRQGKPRQQNSWILHKARFLMEEFQLAKFKVTLPVCHDNIQWSPPRAPWYKIKVDGAVFQASQSAGMGVVIQDHEGRVEALISKNFQRPFGLLEDEAMALEEGVLFPWDAGILDAMFECDSKIIFDAMIRVREPPVNVLNIVLGYRKN